MAPITAVTIGGVAATPLGAISKPTSPDFYVLVPAATPFAALIGRAALPAGALRTLYPRDGSTMAAAEAPALPGFAPRQMWAFASWMLEAPPFDMLYLGADGLAVLASGLPPAVPQTRTLPYRIEGARLCLEGPEPVCLSPEGLDGAEPGLRIAGGALSGEVLPIHYMRLDLDIAAR